MMTDQELQDRLDSAIMKADPAKLSDEELDRRLELSQKNSRVSDLESDNTWRMTPKGLLKGTLAQGPMAGAIAGGLYGSTVGPIGALAGAGLGAMGGYAAQKMGEVGLLDEEPPTRSEYYTDLAKTGLQGATAEGGGQILGKAAEGVSGMLKAGAKIKPNAQAITDATQALGAEPTIGQLSNSRMLQGMESSLEQSPTIGGYLTRRETEPVRDAMQEGSKRVFSDVPNAQPSDVGAKFKTDIRGLIEGRLEPIKKTYDSIRDSTEFIDINPTSLNRIATNLRNSEKFKSSSGYNIVNQTADDLLNVKSVDDLKKLRSSVGKRMSSPMLDGEARGALNNIYAKLSSLEENTIMREAIKQARESGEGLDIGKGLVSDLKGANKAYRGVIQDLGLLGKGSGVSKKVGNIENFLTRIDEIPDEKVVDTFFKTNNRKYLQEFQKIDPEGFDNLRQARLAQLRNQSLTKDEIDPVKVLRNFKKMEPETRALLVGDQEAEILSKLETVVNSWPNKAGPSGTPQGLELMNIGNIINPVFWLKEGARATQYGLLKGASKFNDAAEILRRPSVQTGLRQAPKGLLRGEQ